VSAQGTGIGFAIPADRAEKILLELMRQGYVAHAFLGVGVTDLSPLDALSDGLPSPVGAQVVEVYAGSPAAAAGLSPGDVILAVNGHQVANVAGLVRLMDGRPPGQRATLLVLTGSGTAQVTLTLARELGAKYDVPVLPVNCVEMGQEDILRILEEVLYEFPVNEVNIALPGWVNELEGRHWLRAKFEEAVKTAVGQVRRLRDVGGASEQLSAYEFVQDVVVRRLDAGTGMVSMDVTAPPGLFYQVLSEETGFAVGNETQLLKVMRDLGQAKREFDKVADALQEVRESGYGVVTPRLDEMNLEEPELIRQGNRFGVKLKASAPSLHIIRADITTEITPIIGTEKQCEELVRYMLNEFEENPKKIWDSEIFGKSLHDLVREGIQNKLHRMPENAQVKLQETLQRIVNDGSGGLICIII